MFLTCFSCQFSDCLFCFCTDATCWIEDEWGNTFAFTSSFSSLFQNILMASSWSILFLSINKRISCDEFSVYFLVQLDYELAFFPISSLDGANMRFLSKGILIPQSELLVKYWFYFLFGESRSIIGIKEWHIKKFFGFGCHSHLFWSLVAFHSII